MISRFSCAADQPAVVPWELEAVWRYRKRTLPTTSAFEERKEHKYIYSSFHCSCWSLLVGTFLVMPAMVTAQLCICASAGTFQVWDAVVRLSGTPEGLSRTWRDGNRHQTIPSSKVTVVLHVREDVSARLLCKTFRFWFKSIFTKWKKNCVWPNQLTSSLVFIQPSCSLPNLFMTCETINCFLDSLNNSQMNFRSL